MARDTHKNAAWAPLLILASLTPGQRAWTGDGVGYNGPTDSTLLVPEQLDLGVDSLEVQQAVSACFGNVFNDFREVALGVDGTRLSAMACASRYAHVGDAPDAPGEFNPWCLASARGGQPSFEWAVAPWLHQLSATYQASLDATSSKQSSLISERSFPVLSFERLEKGYQLEESVTGSAFYVSGLAFRLGDDFDSLGHRLRLLPSGNSRHVPPAPEFQVTVNGRSFLDCVQAEIQKAPRDQGMPAASPLPPEVCPELSSWFKLRQSQASSLSSILERSQARVAEWELRQEAIDLLYRNYEAGTLDLKRIEGCLKNDALESEFFQALYSRFYERTLDRLRRANGPGLRKFVKLTDQKYRLNSMRPLFRLTGHYDQNSPSSLIAGVHRASGSIYMDLARIPRDEWYIIFIHEMLHKLDSRLQAAISESAITPGQFSELRRWVNAAELQDLPADIRLDLDLWLRAGMDRGIHAEYRSWLVTLRLYREGVSEGIWERIPRYDALFEEAAASGLAEDRFLHRWLSSRARMPETGIFSSATTQSAIRALQQEAEWDANVLDLGSLQGLLEK